MYFSSDPQSKDADASCCSSVATTGVLTETPQQKKADGTGFGGMRKGFLFNDNGEF